MYVKLATFFALLGVALGAPNHLKAVVVGVPSASVSASAGTAVTAQTDAGDETTLVAPTGASGTTVIGAASVGPSFFDRIFDIPISILHSVNQHLNNRGETRIQRPRGHRRRTGTVAKPVVVTGSTVASTQPAAAAVDVNVRTGTSVDVGSSAAAGPTGSGGATVVVAAQKPPGFYDTVFNIPITALKSVNQLLNG